jgi:hypothetical protein
LNQTLTDRRNPSITRGAGPKSALLSEKSDKISNQVNEEEEKLLILEDPMRKRIFIHVA